MSSCTCCCSVADGSTPDAGYIIQEARVGRGSEAGQQSRSRPRKSLGGQAFNLKRVISERILIIFHVESKNVLVRPWCLFHQPWQNLQSLSKRFVHF